MTAESLTDQSIGGSGDQPITLEHYGVSDIAFEIGHLKRTPRTGWTYLGVSDPESVAEHSHRTAALAYLLAVAAEADADHSAALATFHDLPETRTMDIASVGKKYLNKPNDWDVVSDQTKGLADLLAKRVMNLAREYAAQESLESRIAHDADKLECLTQAMEYSEQGYAQSELFKKGSVESLTTPVGRQFAREILSSFPGHWWADFVENYRSGSSS